MPIPTPLAFPPTALRGVAAGLVVGNPIGSSGTRAKALTSAELKAIVEASGVSYLPLSGGTLTGSLSLGTNALTCGAITASGTLTIRNGLNAQCQIINKSYTSDTSQEALMLDAGKQISGKLGLYSYRGTSGGSNYPIQIGMLAADGSTFSGMSVATSGGITVSGLTSTIGYMSQTDAVTLGWPGSSYGTFVAGDNGSLRVGTLGAWYAPSPGVLSARNAGNSAYAAITCGQITQVPPSSVTLATNGQFSVEMTSDTAGNLVYRGSDGTTRRMALAFT